MYLPEIQDKLRTEPDELSESQRFFIDQSFRMSLLNFFYTGASFFVCETPDSSLDISYEANAARIFVKYLNQPNYLIITTNLNNSEFVERIIDLAPKIKAINLLLLGNPSAVQRGNPKLMQISEEIEGKIHGRFDS